MHTGFPHYPSGVIPAPYRNRAVAARAPRRDHDRSQRRLPGRQPGLRPPAGRPCGAGAVGARHRAAQRPRRRGRRRDAAAVHRGRRRRLRGRQARRLRRQRRRSLAGQRGRAGRAAQPARDRGGRGARAIHLRPRRPDRRPDAGDRRRRWRGFAEAGGKARRLWPVVDLDRFDPRPPADADDARAGPLPLLYAGTLGLAQGLEVLVRASKLAGPEVVQTTIAGDGADAERLRRLVRDEAVVQRADARLGAGRRRFRACTPRADAAAVLLRDLPIFAGALPTKLLEAMAAGRPLVLCAPRGVRRAGAAARAGLVVEPGDPEALAAALRAPARRPRAAAASSGGPAAPTPRPTSAPRRRPRRGRGSSAPPSARGRRSPIRASCCRPVSSGLSASARR